MADSSVGGLTVEGVNSLQDEMNKLDEMLGDDDSAKVGKPKTEGKEPAPKASDEKPTEDTKAETKDDRDDIIRELRDSNRRMEESLKSITGEYQKLQKVMLDKGVITEEEAKQSEAEKAAATAAYNERQNKLMEMVAIMEVNPSYVDVRQVCTQGNLDDIVDAFSRFYVKENGGNQREVAAQMESEIWQELNPYKKIYELVKQYHPRYAPKEESKDGKATTETKEKKVVDVTPSAATIGSGGSGTGSGGWTSAKIDELPETELHTVPKDIYEKYLMGQLK